MRTYISAGCWAAMILLVALGARLGRVDGAAAELLLMVLPMIAFVTLLDHRKCRLPAREA
ncbi:MAG: hypothetical protein ABIU10_01915 [Sphingomicrobium sp.]